MRTTVAILAAAALLGAAAPADAARVRVMVAGQSEILAGPKKVKLKRARLRMDGRRCRVAARTPLAVLIRTRLRVGLRDYGRCGRPRDAGGLYVTSVERERERRQGGWVYKVGRRAGTAPAGDRSGPFGRGGLRRGQRVLWFYCELDAGECQRTLEAKPDSRTASPGSVLRVLVRGFDDHGRGVPAAGATVRLGDSSAVAGEDGVAAVPVPAIAGRHRLTAEHPDMVDAFSSRVTVR